MNKYMNELLILVDKLHGASITIENNDEYRIVFQWEKGNNYQTVIGHGKTRNEACKDVLNKYIEQ